LCSSTAAGKSSSARIFSKVSLGCAGMGLFFLF
jgi:hypothetical protein